MYYPHLSVVLITVSVILPLLAVVAVGLRIKAQYIKRAELNASDYTIALATFVAIGQLIVGIVGGTIGGLGRPLTTLAPETTVIFMKVLFIMQFFHHFAIFFVKLSLVLFYKIIFSTPRFKRVANILIVVLVAWIISFFFGTLFQDNPISRNWGTNVTTINYPVFYTIENCTDVVLDLVILCMPLPVIKSLHMNTRKKWLLGGIFSLGFFCVISSVLRLYYLVVFDEQYTASRIDPFSYSTVNYMIWNTIESCASIVTACLPTYFVLLQNTRIGTWLRTISSGIQASLMTRRKHPPPSSRKPSRGAVLSITSLNQSSDAVINSGSSGKYTETRGDAIEMGNCTKSVEQA